MIVLLSVSKDCSDNIPDRCISNLLETNLGSASKSRASVVAKQNKRQGEEAAAVNRQQAYSMAHEAATPVASPSLSGSCTQCAPALLAPAALLLHIGLAWCCSNSSLLNPLPLMEAILLCFSDKPLCYLLMDFGADLSCHNCFAELLLRPKRTNIVAAIQQQCRGCKQYDKKPRKPGLFPVQTPTCI